MNPQRLAITIRGAFRGLASSAKESQKSLWCLTTDDYIFALPDWQEEEGRQTPPVQNR